MEGKKLFGVPVSVLLFIAAILIPVLLGLVLQYYALRNNGKYIIEKERVVTVVVTPTASPSAALKPTVKVSPTVKAKPTVKAQ